MTRITLKQQRILDAIEEHTKTHGHAPSYRELAQKLGYTSTASIYRFVQSLKKQGLIEDSARGWRNLQSKRQSQSEPSVDIEIIGQISQQNAPELSRNSRLISVPSYLVTQEANVYGLTIQDASFTNEHLLPGDILLVEPTDHVQQGELVLASGEKTIVGHYFEEGEYICFRPNPYAINKIAQNTRYLFGEIQIWGVIIALIRHFGEKHTQAGR